MTNRCMAALDAENYLQEIGAQEGSYFPRIMEVNPSPIMPPAFPRIMEVNPSPITPPAETQPSVQISVEHLNLATSIQYGISSLPVSNNPTTIRRKSSLIIRHSSLSQHMLPPKYKPTSDIPKFSFSWMKKTLLVY
ncbi:nuclear pore complex protein NUP98B-like isoform X2 [Solanum tuberosum]|uniref:nuclear pore complex protein NUP98B-like isoform X2 n=1 Tax=Solanum tuberosum TaxID=4113 RepID=UPI00073A0337|nr:PREDICTED: nuclear pore complex protein NUP98B-like isoform X2 [Solanum tuberosum]